MIPEFGRKESGAIYILRPGAYAVIVNAAGAVAVVKTLSGGMLPGGGQEAGKTILATIVRECREECGLVVEVEACIGVADEMVFAADECTH